MSMPNIGELLIILFIVFLVFGASKLPALGEALGRGIHDLRKGTKDRGPGAPPTA